MRLISTLLLLLVISANAVWAQSVPLDSVDVIPPSRYMLKAKGPSGELILTTGRIVKAIAISSPKLMEIARIYVNYTVRIKLNTNSGGETVAIVTFSALRLSGDLDYKGFDIRDHIFPSLVTFRLTQPGVGKNAGKADEVLATVKAGMVNKGGCSVTIALNKSVSEIPVIDNLAFYHSEDDYAVADGQMKLIDKYYTAGWLMQRTENLLDGMQYTHLNNPSAYLASTLEVIVINDWITRQHFNRFPCFKMKDTLSMSRRLVINGYRKKLIDQDFIKSNVIRNEDMKKAAVLFADNLTYYFDTSQPDYNKATYLSQMAYSPISSIGYKAIHDFASGYGAQHKNLTINWQLFIKTSAIFKDAMTAKASQLTDNEQFSEAMDMLKASENYDLQHGGIRSQADSVLIGRLSQRLYSAYLDFALKSLNFKIYSVTYDYYQKAILLKQSYNGMIVTDSRERYLADRICKDMLVSAEKSIKGNDIGTALALLERVVRIADSARLKGDYETARIRLESLSNRSSGFRPWVGEDLAVVVPVDEIKRSDDKAMTAYEKNKLREKDTAVAIAMKKPKVKAIPAAKVKADSSVLLASIRYSDPLPAKIIPAKKTRGKKSVALADSSKIIAVKKDVFIDIPDIKQQIEANIKSIHLKLWSGDTVSSVAMLNKTDSLQQLLGESGDKSFVSDIRALRINLDELRCEQQKTAYRRELDQIRGLLKSKDFGVAFKQLEKLISRSFPSSCNVDKSDATRLLGSLETPMVYKRWIIQLDSVSKSQDPEAIISAFEKAKEYYKLNMIDKLGFEPPDLMRALKARKEIPFLLKAVSAMLDSHRPGYALELLKEIRVLEIKPDITLSLQKRLGEMLASGDFADMKNPVDLLNGYGVYEKWYEELMVAYKKQWKVFSK
jgi:hypothetical protein